MKVFILSIYNGLSWEIEGVYMREKDVRIKIQILEAGGRYKIDKKEVIPMLNLADTMAYKHNEIDDRMQKAFDDAINGDEKGGKR